METFAPIVNWSTVRFLLTLFIMNRWFARHVDFVLEFSQARCDLDMRLSVPLGFHVNNGNNEQNCIKLNKNLYGDCQASANCFVMIKNETWMRLK